MSAIETGIDAQLAELWQLDRPKQPALPLSYFWTWDHSTNWVLDDPGLQFQGCYNKYFKRPATFLEDYRRLTDFTAGLGIRGIAVAGFLRDSHGGIESAKRMAAYAASRGVAVMPCFGTNFYEGPYYEGRHKYNLSVFLEQYPEARILDETGKPYIYGRTPGASPGHPAFREWLAEAVQWLLDEFEIGGLNLENGDMLVDHNPRTQALRADWPKDDPEEYFFQGVCYGIALDAVRDRLADSMVTFSPYNGFNGGEEIVQDFCMGKTAPAMFEIFPPQAICQWTLTGMLLKPGLPLTDYLDDGAPAAAFENPNWPADLYPMSKRGVGFFHQGSQWSKVGRYDCIVSTVKEACLRGYRCGLEGIAIHGEVSSRHIPNALNYLAFSHFTHWPEDSLRDFGRKTLGHVLGGEREGEEYAVVLAHWDAGTLTDQHKKQAAPASHGFTTEESVLRCEDVVDWQRHRFWHWLDAVAAGGLTRGNTGMFLV